MGLEDVLWCRIARVISLGARNHGDGVKAVVVNLVLLVVGWIV
jgi:hypothetical protein